MENTYNYVFWYNYYTNTWYAIPRAKYVAFFSGIKELDAEGVIKSSKIETLIHIINNPKSIK
jgi:hypothetical protein